MLELVYCLFLLVIMNFYLRFRRNTLSATEKFLISLMSIGVLFGLFYLTARLVGDKLLKAMDPTLNLVFILVMNLLLPILISELVMNVYLQFIKKKK
jgi:hypothetical protein